jgi:hypothetical protein
MPTNVLQNYSTPGGIIAAGNIVSTGGYIIGSLIGAFDNTPIGASIPSTGRFTTLAVLSNLTVATNITVTGNIFGNHTGSVYGNTYGIHTGPVTGNVVGSHTGPVTGDLVGNVTATTITYSMSPTDLTANSVTPRSYVDSMVMIFGF